MAKWRFLSDEEKDEILSKAPVVKPPEDGGWQRATAIYEVAGGTVSRDGEAFSVTPGWMAKLLDEPVDADWCYNVKTMTVRMLGRPVELREGQPVALFPPEYLEKARGQAEADAG